MRKEKQPSFLARKELLTNKENQEYQSNKQAIQRRRFLEEIKSLKNKNAIQERNNQVYDKKSRQNIPIENATHRKSFFGVKFGKEQGTYNLTEREQNRINNIEAKNYQKQLKQQTSRTRYNNSNTGRFGNALSKGLRTVSQRHGVTRALYRNQLPPQSMNRVRRGINGNTRGRPFGTKKHFDENGSQISVYDWRRLQAQKRRIAMQQATINPAQQQVLNNIARRQAYARSNPESQIFPDTNGSVFLDGIMDEISRATRLVD